MGFVAGLGIPTGMGTPTYFINQGNVWDANTYATIIFDNSGSMGTVITAMTSAAIGNYFSSGSAAGSDGVKNADSLRSTIQDLYASSGIEGSPDYNTDNATNGKTEFEKHVQVVSLVEDSVDYIGTPYSYHPSGDWPVSAIKSLYQSANFITPSNFVQVVVCNESNPGYHDSISGSLWGDTEITASYKSHITQSKKAFGDAGSSYNGDSASAPLRAGARVDGSKPSFTVVYVDPGVNGVNGHDGPDLGWGYGTTASQRLWIEGVRDGGGSYGLDALVSGHEYSFRDFETVTAWNGRENLLTIEPLYDQSSNSSVPYWKGVLLNALTKNISI